MANKRMFCKDITNSDYFLDLPTSSQTLYFHLSINADDDGFVQPRSIMRLVGASEDDLKILIAKRFLIEFEDKVIVITHWKINNNIRNDRYNPTVYTEHFKRLAVLENKCYQLENRGTENQPKAKKLVYQMDTNGMHRLDKVSIDKISIGEGDGEQLKKLGEKMRNLKERRKP